MPAAVGLDVPELRNVRVVLELDAVVAQPYVHVDFPTAVELHAVQDVRRVLLLFAYTWHLHGIWRAVFRDH